MRRVFFCLLFCQILFAQKNEDQEISYPIDEVKSKVYSFSYNIFPQEETAIQSFLSEKLNVNLQLLYIKESLGGKHFCYQQTIHGKKVFRSQIKVNVLNNMQCVSVCALVFPVKEPLLFHSTLANNAIYFWNGEKIIPAYQTQQKHHNTNYQYIVDENGQTIYATILNTYFGKKDTTAILSVFNPDPITSAKTVYGENYADNDDNDNSYLTAEIQNLKCTLKFQNDTFFLENDYYKIAELSPPTTEKTISKNNTFSFTRSQQSFEDINCFYHINSYRSLVKALKFHSLVDFKLNIDAHAHDGNDNSSFDEYSSPVQLLFGEGNVDDAEDADVVVHEFGHAISAAASPFSNSGSERKAIDEGFGDYIAASYSRSISEYLWYDIFNWDGHNPFFEGRTAKSIKIYPYDYKNNKWKDGEMWSSTLMQLWEDLGASTTNSLVFQALYSQTTNTTMPMAAQLIINADSALFKGKNHSVIYKRMFDRGFIDAYQPTNEPIQIINTENFAMGGNLLLYFSSESSGNVELFDVTGKKIDEISFSNINHFEYFAPHIALGIYVLRISTSSKQISIKLARYR